MLWLLLVVAAALGAGYYRWSRRRLYQIAREIPSGLKEYPILGHAYMLIGNSEDQMKAVQEFGRASNSQGGLSHFWMTNRLFIGITDPNAIAVVSKACLDKDEFTTKFMRTVLGNGSVFAPAGIKVKAQENPNHWVFHAIDTLTEIVSTRSIQPWMHPDFIYKRLPIYKMFLDYRSRAYDYVDDIVKTKREELAAAHATGKEINKDGVISFLEMTMQPGEKNSYSDLELREEVLGLIVAGNDTSAVGSCFTAVMLSRYPDVQEKVYQELKEVFGDSNRPVTPEDLPKFKYLEAVIKESLRLYPPVPMVVREVHNDVVLPSGTTLVNGTSLVLHIWGTHRNPTYWGEDAGQFRPERFLEGPLQHPVQFIPFSYSVRNCIGATYALMSMKTGLANLLQRYRLLPPANMAAAELTRPLRVRFDIMMKDVDKFIVRVEERNAM